MSSDATHPSDLTTAAYGAWPSPFSAQDTVSAGTTRATPVVAGASVWWLEARVTDAGRLTLVRGGIGAEPVQVSPPGANVRTALSLIHI